MKTQNYEFMADEKLFAETFEQLKTFLQPFAARLETKENQPDKYVLISQRRDHKNKEIYFAALEIKKNYVSFHFLPVYDFPALLADVSPALKQRMQGKSCFNFAKVETALFDELKTLIENGFENYRRRELI